MSAPRSIGWSLGGQVATLLASLVSTMILGRLLTPVDFGAFAFAVTIYSMVQWLLQTGMGTYLIREPDLTREKIDTALAVSVIQGVAAAVIIAAISPLAGWFGESATIGWVTLSVAIVPLACAPEGVIDGLWLRDGLYGRYAVLQVMKSAMQTVVSIAAQLWFHWGVFALVAGLLAYAATSLAFALWVLARQYRSRPKKWPEHWAEVRSFGSRNLLLVLGQTGSTRLPDLIIGRMLSVFTLGHYNRAANTLDMITRTLAMSMARALTPSFFRRVGEGNKLDEEVGRLLNGLLFLCWPSLAGVAILSAPIIRLVYGPQWGLAAQVLPMLCLAFAIDTARSGAMESLMARDRITLNARIEFVHAFYAVALIFVGAHFGLAMALWAKVADSVITLVVYFVAMRRIDALPVHKLGSIFGTNLLLTGAAAAPAFLLMHHWHWPDALDLGQYALAIGGSVALWLIACAAIGHPYFRQGAAIIGRRLGRVAA